MAPLKWLLFIIYHLTASIRFFEHLNAIIKNQPNRILSSKQINYQTNITFHHRANNRTENNEKINIRENSFAFQKKFNMFRDSRDSRVLFSRFCIRCCVAIARFRRRDSFVELKTPSRTEIVWRILNFYFTSHSN